MKKNIYKKITTLIYLAIFLFGLFMPFNQIFAQSPGEKLIILANTKIIESNKDVIITAKGSWKTVGDTSGDRKIETINFSSSSNTQGSNNFAKCNQSTVANNSDTWSCSVKFRSSVKEIYTITASYFDSFDNKTYQAPPTNQPLKIEVCDVSEILEKETCVSPKINTFGTITLSTNPNPPTISPGQLVQITATVPITKGGQVISFFTAGDGKIYSFSPKAVTGNGGVCKISTSTTAQTRSCSITFGSFEEGTFRVNVLVYANAADFVAAKPDPLVVNVEGVDIIVKNPYSPITIPAIQTPPSANTTYTPLAPLPGLGNAICKDKDGKDVACIETNPKIQSCPFGNYLNIIIKLILGIAGVLAMIMIVTGGIEYMISDLVSSKEAGKETITHAILGLLIALGAYMILNTINPQLLSACLDKLPEATITIKDFEVSGGLTFDGKPIKINFNKEAYPAAKFASEKTNVPVSLILAIFDQETSSGARTGSCTYKDANMGSGELENLKLITKDWETVKMSCSGGASEHGGAIGFTQFTPSTWLDFRDKAAAILGHQPSAWDLKEALLMEALKLKKDGGDSTDINNQKEAACKYFGGSKRNCSYSAGINAYGNSVMGKKLSFERQIEEAIKKGEIN